MPPVLRYYDLREISVEAWSRLGVRHDPDTELVSNAKVLAL